MNQQDTLTVLHQFKQTYAQEFVIVELGVFGSVARGEAHENSDVDICIKILTPNPFALVRLKTLIESKLNRRVDIVRVRENMNPFLKARIEAEARYV